MLSERKTMVKFNTETLLANTDSIRGSYLAFVFNSGLRAPAECVTGTKEGTLLVNYRHDGNMGSKEHRILIHFMGKALEDRDS